MFDYEHANKVEVTWVLISLLGAAIAVMLASDSVRTRWYFYKYKASGVLKKYINADLRMEIGFFVIFILFAMIGFSSMEVPDPNPITEPERSSRLLVTAGALIGANIVLLMLMAFNAKDRIQRNRRIRQGSVDAAQELMTDAS